MAISRQDTITFLGGILSGGLFSLMAFHPGGSVLSIFLPVLPLALLGLSLSAKHIVMAALVACLVIVLFLGGEGVMFFAVFLAFPVCHFVRKALMWREGEEAGQKQWYPVLTILSNLLLVSAVMFMIFALTVRYSENTELRTMISDALISQIDTQAGKEEPEMAAVMRTLATDWVFMLFACMAWMWVTVVYLFTTLANMFLKSNNIALRPSLAVTQDGLPLWLPAVLLLSACLALFGQGNDQFAGETVFTIMMMPYFLCGVAAFNAYSRRWRNRVLWLTIFYAALLPCPWIALFLIARGLHLQIEGLVRLAREYQGKN